MGVVKLELWNCGCRMGLIYGNCYFVDGDAWSELRSFIVMSECEENI